MVRLTLSVGPASRRSGAWTGETPVPPNPDTLNWTRYEAFFPHRLSVDHIVPESHGGLAAPANLALCCYACQQKKSAFDAGHDPATKTAVPLFNPRRQRWSRHFRWSPDELELIGLTRVGRATIER